MSTSPGPSPDDLLAVGARRRARERALELLYEAENKALSPDEVLAALPFPPESYAVELFLGVGAHFGEIDALIAEHATDWALGRMPVVDRQLLRVSTYELVYAPEVPVAVVIDEAVELAKQYSTEESGRFVNGVLAAIAAAVRSPPARSAPS